MRVLVSMVLLLTAIPIAASAQQMPNWPIEELCSGDERCRSREVGSRDLLEDWWKEATPQKRKECLAWEAGFFRRRYGPERSGGLRYTNLASCVDGMIDPRAFPWH
jgi:hypothetical protein